MREHGSSSVVEAVRPVTVRLRCSACEVAWSGPTDSDCWVCGAIGTPLNTATTGRPSLLSFEAELLV
jgi:hypothetical protein